MAFSLNQTTVLSAFRSGNLLSAVNSMISPGYGIYYASGQRVGDKPFTPTSFIAVEVTREASNHYGTDRERRLYIIQQSAAAR
ncbi:hypothetical protein [Photorhabdus bodei]|uniref:hypothetical protein n=1 Tax=Photorhabdus bodei TaxID=2029681 RepID=UPI001EFD8FB8|nr:hypothetical protein [Photorhabdus bodei]